MTRHLLSIKDLTRADILGLAGEALKIKRHPARYAGKLAGKTLGLVFEKPSTRTRVSFQVAMAQLGGEAQYLGPQDITLGRREALHDEARVLSRYWDAVVLRTFRHETIEQFAAYSRVPVINGLSNRSHPCQALADFMTITEHSRSQNPVVAYVGDGNNVLHSLLYLFARIGGHFHFVTPKAFGPLPTVLKEAYAMAKKSGALIQQKDSPLEAVRVADFVYTDVWVSMGEEANRRKKVQAFKQFQINRRLLAQAEKTPYVLHCLPAHRGEEITDEVIESKQSIVFVQAQNRLHMEKAMLLELIG